MLSKPPNIFIKIFFTMLFLVLLLANPFSEATYVDETQLTEKYIVIQNNTIASTLSPSYVPPENLLKNRAILLDGQWGGQCVYFVQHFLNIFEDCVNTDCQSHPFKGYAGNIKPNSTEPEIGNAVIFKGGHTAVIIKIYNDELELVESNYNFDELITVGRMINTNDTNITGYYKF